MYESSRRCLLAPFPSDLFLGSHIYNFEGGRRSKEETDGEEEEGGGGKGRGRGL